MGGTEANPTAGSRKGKSIGGIIGEASSIDGGGAGGKTGTGILWRKCGVLNSQENLCSNVNPSLLQLASTSKSVRKPNTSIFA